MGFEVYEDTEGDWRWRCRAPNGEIVVPPEGYTRKEDAERGINDAVAAMLTSLAVEIEYPEEDSDG